MTDALEGDKYVTLQLVWTTFIQINELLVTSDHESIDAIEDGPSSMVANMKEIGREYVKKNKKDMSPTFEHKALTFLTPNYKKLIFVDHREKYGLRCEIEDYIKLNYSETDRQNETRNNATTVAIDHDDRFVSFDLNDVGNDATEIDSYMNHPIPSHTDSVTWWRSNFQSYPNLYRLFKELSCIPATSASSEREFSLSGNIITDKRSMLLPGNVNDLIVSRNVL